MADQRVPTIFSRRRRILREARARRVQTRRSDAANWLTEAMTEDIVERIGFMRLAPKRALVLGLGGERIARALESTCACEIATSFDPVATYGSGEYDLIVSLARLDTVNDLPGRLILIRHALAKGGILLATIPGAGSLPMLRRMMLAGDGERASPRIHPQIDNRAATMLLERAGFARQVVDGYGIDVRYGSLQRLVDDLRDQGMTSALDRPGPPLGKAALARAEAQFAALAGEDGKIVEHFALLTLTGWKD